MIIYMVIEICFKKNSLLVLEAVITFLFFSNSSTSIFGIYLLSEVVKKEVKSLGKRIYYRLPSWQFEVPKAESRKL